MAIFCLLLVAPFENHVLEAIGREASFRSRRFHSRCIFDCIGLCDVNNVRVPVRCKHCTRSVESQCNVQQPDTAPESDTGSVDCQSLQLLRQSGTVNGEREDISICFSLKDSWYSWVHSAMKRRSSYLVVRQFLHNAFRHWPAWTMRHAHIQIC